MGVEVFTISVGGMAYSAFERINVHASFGEAARTFELEVAAELGSSATNGIFNVGADVTISVNGDLLLTGFVDTKEPEFDAFSAIISVSGRSNSGDLIDGSAEHETGQFENKDPKEIGDEISSNYRPKFQTDQQLEKVEQYQLTQGETCFRCVEKLARAQGMTLAGTADGNINITKAGSKRQGGSIIEGVNLLRGKAHHNGANRHSKYKVRGQRPFGHGQDNLEIEAEESDGAVKRHRALILIQDEDTTKARAKKRAKNRKDRAAGDGLKATIVVQGCHDDGGQLWEPGNLVWTQSPFLDIAQDMLIESCDWRQDKGGTVTTLQLTDPRSYGGEGGKGNQSGGEWNQ
jgi:prophage tail gpP-like protein